MNRGQLQTYNILADVQSAHRNYFVFTCPNCKERYPLRIEHLSEYTHIYYAIKEILSFPETDRKDRYGYKNICGGTICPNCRRPNDFEITGAIIYYYEMYLSQDINLPYEYYEMPFQQDGIEKVTKDKLQLTECIQRMCIRDDNAYLTIKRAAKEYNLDSIEVQFSAGPWQEPISPLSYVPKLVIPFNHTMAFDILDASERPFMQARILPLHFDRKNALCHRFRIDKERMLLNG